VVVTGGNRPLSALTTVARRRLRGNARWPSGEKPVTSGVLTVACGGRRRISGVDLHL